MVLRVPASEKTPKTEHKKCASTNWTVPPSQDTSDNVSAMAGGITALPSAEFLAEQTRLAEWWYTMIRATKGFSIRYIYIMWTGQARDYQNDDARAGSCCSESSIKVRKFERTWSAGLFSECWTIVRSLLQQTLAMRYFQMHTCDVKEPFLFRFLNACGIRQLNPFIARKS